METTKRTRKKRDLSSFIESEDKMLERLRKTQENRKKYILNMFKKVFTEILTDGKLLEVIDRNKDDKEFQDNLSSILKQEILKYDEMASLEEEESLNIEGNNE